MENRRVNRVLTFHFAILEPNHFQLLTTMRKKKKKKKKRLFHSYQFTKSFLSHSLFILFSLSLSIHILTIPYKTGSYLPTYLPTYQSTYLPTNLPTYQSTYLRTYLPTNIPTYLQTLTSITTFLRQMYLLGRRKLFFTFTYITLALSLYLYNTSFIAVSFQ